MRFVELSADGSQCFVCGSKQRSRFIQYHRDRNVVEHTLELPFIPERAEKFPVFDLFDDFHRDAARYIDPAERQHLQSKIACFLSVDAGPKIERLDTNGARPGEAH